MNAQKFRFVLLGLILLTIGGGIALGYFAVNYLHQQVALTDKVKIEAELNTQASADAGRAQQQLNNEQVARLDGYLKELVPEAPYREQFIADVNIYALESGISLASIRYEPEGKAPPIKGSNAVTVTLGLDGEVPYDNFIAFVKRIENNLQHMQVLTLNMSPSPDDRSILTSPGISVALYLEPEKKK